MQDEEGGQELSFSSADELNLLNSYTTVGTFLCSVGPAQCTPIEKHDRRQRDVGEMSRQGGRQAKHRSHCSLPLLMK